jgi:DNA-binding beta-propeller fold protein YncE
LVTNGGPTEANRDELAKGNPVADLFGRVLRIRHDGDIQRLVDVWGFERDNNPDAKVANPAVDSNAVDVLADHGRLIVADAGGNSLLKARKDGSIEVLSLFANRLVPFMGDQIPMQAVPTGVVKGPGGDYFMSQLTGFPFPPGGANVYRVDRTTGNSEVFASGFTNIMDLAFDATGTLWVLEIDHDSLFAPVGPSSDGAIFAVDAKGNKRQLELPAGTLTHPGGITVGKDGALYVTNNGATAGNGEVLRIEVGASGEDDHDDDEHDDD